MARLSLHEIKELSDRNGHCDKCGRVIKIYKYAANKPLATFLYRMHELARPYDALDKPKAVDLRDMHLPYSTLTQITKLRLHGLVVQKTEDGKKVPHTWIITHKGWKWLNGGTITQKVVVFDNQVLGHDGPEITFIQAMKGVTPKSNEYEQENISTPEANMLHDMRKPNGTKLVLAKFIGRDTVAFKKNQLYDIEIKRMQLGRPVEAYINGEVHTYVNPLAFVKLWQIVTEAQ